MQQSFVRDGLPELLPPFVPTLLCRVHVILQYSLSSNIAASCNILYLYPPDCKGAYCHCRYCYEDKLQVLHIHPFRVSNCSRNSEPVAPVKAECSIIYMQIALSAAFSFSDCCCGLLVFSLIFFPTPISIFVLFFELTRVGKSLPVGVFVVVIGIVLLVEVICPRCSLIPPLILSPSSPYSLPLFAVTTTKKFSNLISSLQDIGMMGEWRLACEFVLNFTSLNLISDASVLISKFGINRHYYCIGMALSLS